MMNTRSNADTFIQDEQAKRILFPFIEDGENIKAERIAKYSKNRYKISCR